MQVRKILMVNGNSQYDSLRYFTNCLADELIKMGMHVDFYEATKEIGESLWKDIGYDLVISFNGMWDYQRSDSILIDKNTPVLSILVDHPYHHVMRLLESNRRQFIACLDRQHVCYTKKYYANNEDSFFFPLAGELQHEIKDWEKRKYNIAFFGTYNIPEHDLSSINQFSEDIQYVIWQIIDKINRDSSINLEETFLSIMDTMDVKLSNQQISSNLEKWKFIDKYIRDKRRHDVICKLLESGIQVHVFGKNWDSLDTIYKDNLIIHPQCSFKESLELMTDCKIVLNNMPLFTDGAHDRVFNSMGAGAICLTDKSKYFEEEFCDGENIYFYDINHLKHLPEIVKNILNCPEKSKEVAKCGYETVKQNHLWKNRAHALIEYFEKIEAWDDMEVVECNRTDREFNQLCNYFKNSSIEKIKSTMENRFVMYISKNEKYMEQYDFEMSRRYGEMWKPFDSNYEIFRKRTYDIRKNISKIVDAYNLLEDYKSKKILLNILCNWINMSVDKLFLIQAVDKCISPIQDTVIECGIGDFFLLENIINKPEHTFKQMHILVDSEEEYKKMKLMIRNVDNVFLDYTSAIENIKENSELYEDISYMKFATTQNIEYLEEVREIINSNHPRILVQADNYDMEIFEVVNKIHSIDKNYKIYIRYYGNKVIAHNYYVYAVMGENNEFSV